jgi:hypothetical protein
LFFSGLDYKFSTTPRALFHPDMPLQFLKASEKAGEIFLVAFFVFVLVKSIGFKTQR